jgi:hypothetical protein
MYYFVGMKHVIVEYLKWIWPIISGTKSKDISRLSIAERAVISERKDSAAERLLTPENLKLCGWQIQPNERKPASLGLEEA